MWVRAQGYDSAQLAEDYVTASLVVVDPGEVLYSTLGHACLHMQCPTFGKDLFYTYEGEPVQDQVWTFLKGDLKMGMFALTKEDFLRAYRDEKRGAREYVLNLSPEQELRLWQVLDERVAQGPYLPYDYFHRGCAKAVVTVVKEALGADSIQYAPWPERYVRETQRELVRDAMGNSPWSAFELYCLIGADGDRSCSPEQKLIVPTDLVEVWQQANVDGRPLLIGQAQELIPSFPPQEAPWLTPLLVAIGLLIVSWWTPYPMLAVQTILGLVMTYLVVFSKLPCTDWNWLIIPFNPLPALLWHWRRYWALPWAGVLGVWCLTMIVWPHHLVDWSQVVLTAAMMVVLVKNSRVPKKLK